MQYISPIKRLFLFAFFIPFWTFQTFASDASNKSHVSFAAKPDWIKQIDLIEKSYSDMRSPSHYQLVDSQVKVDDSISHQYYSRYVYTLTDSSGIESQSDIRVSFDPLYEKVVFHHIEVKRRGKVIQRYTLDDIDVITSENDQDKNIFSGRLEALLLLKDIRVADQIDYAFSTIGSNPVFNGKFTASGNVNWSIPVDVANFRVITPEDRPLHHKLFKSEGKVIETLLNDQIEYTFYAQNTEEIYQEDSAPSWFTPYGQVQFSEYNSWQEVGNWAHTLFELNAPLSEDLHSYVNELKALPKQQAIEQAIQFVQNEVRYLGLELGVNSHKPHHPNEVFENRSGDCKDKSLLLTRILRELDVKITPALVSSTIKRSLKDALPSHSVFDHAITMIEMDGNKYWIDPTVTHQGNQLSSKYQFNYELALLISPTTTELVSAEVSSQAKSKIMVSEKIQAADYFSPVDWKIKTTYTGREAEKMRLRVRSSGLKLISRQYLDYYAKSYPSISTLSKLTVNDDAASNTLSTVEHYLIDKFWTRDDNNGVEFTLNANYSNQYMQLPSSIRREQPLSIYKDIKVDHSVTLQLPEKIDFSQQAYDRKLGDDYVSQRSTLSYDNRFITLRNVYNPMADHVPPEDVASHIESLYKIGDYTGFSGSITNVTLDTGIDQTKHLIDVLNKKRLSHSAVRGE